jgi:MFS family permease
LTLSLLLHGAVSTGALASVVDISPNYASITIGIVSTFAIMTGFVSPIMVGYITQDKQSIEAWQHIFEITAAMLISCGAIYVLFFDASLQPWNNSTTKDTRELVPLRNDEKEEQRTNDTCGSLHKCEKLSLPSHT